MSSKQQGLICAVNRRSGEIETFIGLELIGSAEMFRRMIQRTCADLERRGFQVAVITRTVHQL